MNRKIASGLFLSAIGIYIAGPQTSLRTEAEELPIAIPVSVVDNRAKPTATASDGADYVGADALARSGAEHGTGQVAANGADHVGAKGLASDGADRVGAKGLTSDGADHVGAKGLASDGADHVGAKGLASDGGSGRVGGIGSDAVASLK